MPLPPAIFIPFDASLAPRTGGSRISVSGEVDLTTAPHLRGLLTEATRSTSGPVEVDLGEVSFCDVSGVNALVVARAALIALGRQLVLLNVPTRIARVLLLAAGPLLLEPA
jgi:anti-sigma B factor antagonist